MRHISTINVFNTGKYRLINPIKIFVFYKKDGVYRFINKRFGIDFIGNSFDVCLQSVQSELNKCIDPIVFYPIANALEGKMYVYLKCLGIRLN